MKHNWSYTGKSGRVLSSFACFFVNVRNNVCTLFVNNFHVVTANDVKRRYSNFDLKLHICNESTTSECRG